MNSESPTRKSTDSSSSQRRRSSAGMFGNLQQYKRDGTAFDQRRTSISEQTATKPGFIGSMFNSMVKGHGSPK